MKRWRGFLLLAGMAAFSLACTLPTLAPAGSPPAAGEVLFRDDFSDLESGWDTWDNGLSFVRYEYGGLRILVNEPHFDYWSRPKKNFGDVRLEVEAAKLGGPDNNDFGLLCRYQDRDNFYAFLVSSDGYGGILKVKDGSYELIGEGQLQYNETIRQGSAANYLRAECVGARLSLFVNGQKLHEVQDADFSSGDVGVIVGAYEVPGVDIFFDNFVVYNP